MAAYVNPYLPPQGWSKARIAAVTVVVLAHLAFFMALNNSLNIKFIPKISIPIVTRLIEDTANQPKPEPKPPTPQVTEPAAQTPEVPVPDIVVDQTNEAAPQAVTTDANASSEPSSVATEATVDPNHPLTQPPYPPQSRRMGEQGSVELLLYVLPNGRVGEARVGRSSGYPALDDSAMREAKRAWRFVPLQRGGVAAAGWVTIAVKFQLT